MQHRIKLLIFMSLLAGLPGLARGQGDTLRAELVALGALPPPGIVAAKVSGKAVDTTAVNRIIAQTLRGRPPSKAALPGLEAQALEQVINRQLILIYLDEKGITVTDEDIDKVIAERQKAARKKNGDLADTMANMGLTPEAYRDELDYELRWAKFAASMITDDRLEKFFAVSHQDFDGTELRVSHILLRPDGPLNPEQGDALVKRAETIRDEIIGEISTFEDAAKRYSLGPSRAKGGDIGFISRHGLMPEEFSTAAFRLKPGELSQPVVTHLGVHLIQCTDVRPGKKTWRDVRKEIYPAAMQNLFNDLAGRMRGRSSIEYTGDVPHLDPTTGKLIEPGKESKSQAAETE